MLRHLRLRGIQAVIWAIVLAGVQCGVLTRTLPFKLSRARPGPALAVSTDEAECFSDYMALWIPRSHVEGLRQWLGRNLHFPGNWRAPHHVDSFLAKCGYFLHPDINGGFIFLARYSACLVKKEKANYRLEIKIFQKGVRRLEQSNRYIMKCPVVTSRLSQERVHCGPTYIQVSRPLPLESTHGQTPWLLSLRGELVASLEDAGLMGLYVDINATTITIQGPRQDLLQRREELNTSAELLPLWLVSGYYAFSLEAACPPVSSQPESEVLVHIPKQSLGLVKRGSRIEESLSLTFLQVHPSSTFTISEGRDLMVVSIPAARVLQVQQCQEAQGILGTQAFYRVDLTLEFAETATPILWTVENVFPCVASGTDLPAAAATPETAPSPLSPGQGTPLAGMPSSSLVQTTGGREEKSQGLGQWPSDERANPAPSPCSPPVVSSKGPGPHPASGDPVGPKAPLFHHYSSKKSPHLTPSPATSSSNSEHSPEIAGDPESPQMRVAPFPAVWPSSQPLSARRQDERRQGGGSAVAVHANKGRETQTLPIGLQPGAPGPGVEKQLEATAPMGYSLGQDLQTPQSPPRAPISDAASFSAVLSLKEHKPFLHTARTSGRSRAPAVPISPRLEQGPPGPRVPLGGAGLPGHSLPSATLSSGASGVVPGSPRPAFPDPTALALHLASEAAPPQPLPWRFEQPKVSTVSGQSATQTDRPGNIRPEQESPLLSGSPLLLGQLLGGHGATTEPIRRQPEQAREVVQPVGRPSMTSPTEEAMGSCRSLRGHQETPSITEPTGPPRGGLASPRREPEGTWTRHPQNLVRTWRHQDPPSYGAGLPQSQPQGPTELGGPFPAGQGASPQQEPTESTWQPALHITGLQGV